MRHIFVRILAAGLLAFSLAASQAYKFEVTQKLQVGETQLQPGNYSVLVDGAKVVLKDKKGNPIEVKATVEQEPSKADSTTMGIGINKDTGAKKLKSVTFGGTTIRVVFE